MDETYPCVLPNGVVFQWTGTFSLTNARLIIYADASSVYDSGCVTTSTTPSDVTIPAGTTDVRVYVDCPCGGDPGSAWVFGWSCDFTP